MLLQSISDIAAALRASSKVSQVGTANAFGDDQLNVDVMAENTIREAISKCASVVTASSEEDPVERIIPRDQESGERYAIAFDPLDGSSIIAPNWSVGTIIGIWEGNTTIRQHPEKQIAAILGVYGPRTTAIVALRIPSCKDACFEVGFSDAPSNLGDASLEVIHPAIQLQSPPFKTRYFAPANLRAAAEDPKYMGLITHFISQKYTLRYSGGLVPDIVHTLVKGHGVYISPVTAASMAKLRRLYELAPIALVVECAGGLALDAASGQRILEMKINDTDERGGLICGTKDEVEGVSNAFIG
jgi:sedoheptulose-bisphosphatase